MRIFIGVLLLSFCLNSSSSEIEKEFDLTELNITKQEALNLRLKCGLILAQLGHEGGASVTMENIISTVEMNSDLKIPSVEDTKSNLEKDLRMIKDAYFPNLEMTRKEVYFFYIGHKRCLVNAVVDKLFIPLEKRMNP